MDCDDEWDAAYQEEVGAPMGQSESESNLFAAPAVPASHSPIVRKPGKGKGRGGGRPRGSSEFHALRHRQITEAAGEEQQLVAPDRSKQPGTIEYARKARQEYAIQRHAQQQFRSGLVPTDLPRQSQSELQKHGDMSDMFSIGSTIQRDLISCSTSAFKQFCSDTLADDLVDHMTSEPLMSMSLKALEKKIGQTNVGRRMISITSAILELSFFMWGMLLCIISRLCNRTQSASSSSAAAQHIMLFLKVRYDETPTKIRICDPGCTAGMETADAAEAAASMPSETATVRAKIFQSELSIGCLLKTHDETDGKPFKWIFDQTPTALQCLEDGTGQSIRSALLTSINRIPELERVSQLFPLTVRHSCCDRYVGNFKAEELLQRDLPLFTLAHTTCDIHKLYSVTESTTGCLSFDVSGILSVGLGISPDVNCVRRLRSILAKILANELVIHYSEPPVDIAAAAYRTHVFDLFLPLKKTSYPGKHLGLRRTLQRRWVIQYFLNGDWTKEEVTHYCGYSCCPDAKSTLRAMSTWLSWALIPHKCPRFARSRWTNWIESVQWCGVLGAIHNLLPSIILEYTGGIPSEMRGSAAEVLDNAVQDAAPLDHDEWDDMYDTEIKVKVPVETNVGQQPQQNTSTETLPPEPAPNLDWAAFNEAQRGNARAWVQTQPFSRLVILQEVSAILMALMYHFLALGGSAWEKKQRSVSAKGGRRQYAICMAANGQRLSETMGQLHLLFFSGVPCLQPSMITCWLKAMRFRMLGSALCAFHILLRLPRQGCPYLLFKVLDGCFDVADCPECMWDPLTHLLRKRFAS